MTPAAQADTAASGAGLIPAGYRVESDGVDSIYGMFPSSDHFPLGRAYGEVDTVSEPASGARPFALTLAVTCKGSSCLAPAKLEYDEDRQIGLVRDNGAVVPLSRHTDGQTNTVTQGGDGYGTNIDSDTDWRED